MVIDGMQMMVQGLEDLVGSNYRASITKLKTSLTKMRMSRLRETKDEIEAKIKDRERLQRQERNKRYYRRLKNNSASKRPTSKKSSAGLGTILKYFHEKIQSD